MAIKRNADGKIIAKKFSIAKLQRAVEDGTIGFCRACGAEAHGVEPDARKYTCERCELPYVYGAEELAIMTAF